MSKTVNVQNFAERVERLCDFLLEKKRRDGGVNGDQDADIRVIQDLKEDAADLATGKITATETLTGLSDFMKGI